MKKARLWAVVLSMLLLVGVGLWLPTRHVVPVLMYHSIGIPRTDRDRLNTISPARFEQHLAFIKRHGYRVLSLDEYYSYASQKIKFPPKSLVITFDDGYEDNYTHAYPVLKKYRVPATIFVIVDKALRLEKYDNLPLLKPDQLLELSRHDILIGSHTATHAYLPESSAENLRKEIFLSKQLMEALLRKPVEYLAYPTGGFNDAAKRALKEAGYKAAFTTNRGRNRLNQDLFEIKRIRPNNHDSDFVFWVKISGYYNLFRSTKNPF